MSKETAVIALGVWIAVLPYLGVPRSWLTMLLVVSALLLIVLGFLLRAEALSRHPRHGGRNHTFVEHMPGEGSQLQLGHERKDRLNSLN